MTSSAKFIVTPAKIESVLIIEPSVMVNEFGWFMESFNARDLSVVIGSDIKFVQDNQSFSKQWTLRGIHYQVNHPQGKLVHVVQGSIFDVVVDVRKNSATYGEWIGIELTAENHKIIWIPPDLGHGFLVLSLTAEVTYKTTDHYHSESEACLAWSDLEAGINWPLPDGIDPIMSTKDSKALSLRYPKKALLNKSNY